MARWIQTHRAILFLYGWHFHLDPSLELVSFETNTLTPIVFLSRAHMSHHYNEHLLLPQMKTGSLSALEGEHEVQVLPDHFDIV